MSAHRPDRVYNPNGTPMPSERIWWREVALALPNLAKLLTRLARDPRVPPRSKTFAGFMVAYLVSPIDLDTRFHPVPGPDRRHCSGRFRSSTTSSRLPDSKLSEHWDGEDDVLDMIVDIVDFAAGFVPRAIRVALNRMLRR